MGSPTPAVSAEQFLPERITLTSLYHAAQSCRGCPLYQNATQTVFGKGRSDARVVLVGEQPGNDEDLQGEPFVGPAGRVLDQALHQAGIARADAYVTNVVKHSSGRRRGSAGCTRNRTRAKSAPVSPGSKRKSR
jgi:DNA polymerase